LDRLSRDAHFLLGLQKAGVRFVAADMPEANEMIVGIMAVVAQAERKMISARTKDALQAAKARGVKLGGDRGNLPAVAAQGRLVGLAVRQKAAQQRLADLAPIVADLRVRGAASLRQIATGLNDRGIPAARGGRWNAAQVRRLEIV
jgi:DNA invertase Pin-like site-specific DNA recombinase